MTNKSAWPAAQRILLALSLTLLGCSSVVSRDVMVAEQRRIEGAIQPGTSARDAAQALVGLGYTCHEAVSGSTSISGAPPNSTVTDCAKPVQGKTELLVCLWRTENLMKFISYGSRPLCEE